MSLFDKMITHFKSKNRVGNKFSAATDQFKIEARKSTQLKQYKTII